MTYILGQNICSRGEEILIHTVETLLRGRLGENDIGAHDVGCTCHGLTNSRVDKDLGSENYIGEHDVGCTCHGHT